VTAAPVMDRALRSPMAGASAADSAMLGLIESGALDAHLSELAIAPTVSPAVRALAFARLRALEAPCRS
jgi:hypothetical protein